LIAIQKLVKDAFQSQEAIVPTLIVQGLVSLYPDRVIRFANYNTFPIVRLLQLGFVEGTFSPVFPESIGFHYNGEEFEEFLHAGLIEFTWKHHSFLVMKLPIGRGSKVFILGPSDPVILELLRYASHVIGLKASNPEIYEHGYWNQDEALTERIRSASLELLDLCPEKIDQVSNQVLGFFQQKDRYHAFGIPWRRGLLLTGPPGNGKSQLIAALAGCAPARALFVKSISSDPKEAQGELSEVFEKVRDPGPCMLILEDIDSLITSTLLSPFLNELDGAKPLEGVCVIATTNHPEKLDPAIRSRPSRFDRVIEFGPPTANDRTRFLERTLAKWNAEMTFDPKCPELHVRIEDFSYAAMRELTTSAMMAWFLSPEKGMATALLQAATEIRNQMIPRTAEDSPGSLASPKQRRRGRRKVNPSR